jgi:formylglycine-generating enzyme required for sulfatase activity
MILDAGADIGLIAPDVAASCRSAGVRALQVLVERQGFSKEDLEKLLERFWSQNGSRRGQLHREVEDLLVADALCERSLVERGQADRALEELRERTRAGERVRLLSVLIDAGALQDGPAREVLEAVRGAWTFCRYCLSAFNDRSAGDKCGVCDRPVTDAARSYELVDLATIDTSARAQRAPAARDDDAEAPAHEPPPVGGLLAGFKLLEKVNRSGRGVVYRGERPDDGERRAVKVWRRGKHLRLPDVERFQSAALSASHLDHEGILKVYEASEEHGHHYVVSEWVEGRTLQAVVEQDGPLDPRAAAQLLVRLAKSLEAAHQQGVLHKNITPSNILITAQGGVKVSDFGVAKDYGVSMDSVQGAIIGSPDYLAPEQCQGEKSDARTDVFSLGAVMYFALTGRPPYEGDSPVAIVVKRLTHNPEPLRKAAPKVPRDLARTVEWMMARKSADRPASLAVVAERAEAFIEGRKPGKLAAIVRRWGPAVAATLAAVLLLAGGVWWWLNRPTDTRIVAEINAALAWTEKDRFREAAEDLRAAAMRHGLDYPEMQAGFASLGERARQRAEGLAAAENNFPAALRTLEDVRIALDGTSHMQPIESASGDLDHRKALYEGEARTRWEELQRELAQIGGARERLEAVQAFRKSFPYQPLDSAAEVVERRARAGIEQLELVGQIEEHIARGEVQPAREKIARARAIDTDDEQVKAQLDELDAELSLAVSIKEALELVDRGAEAEGLARLERLRQRFSGRTEPRQALAKARHRIEVRAADEAEAAGDLDGALTHLDAAIRHAVEGGIDAVALRTRRQQLEGLLTGRRKAEERQRQLVQEGDLLMERGRAAEALVKYEAARSLLGESYPALDDKIARARASAGAVAEGAAYEALLGELKSARANSEKIALLDAFLRDHPDGAYASTVREQRAKLVREIGGVPIPGGGARDSALRPGSRRGEFINIIDGSVMVKIEAGPFVRGSTEGEVAEVSRRWAIDMDKLKGETPRQTVTVGAFYVDVFEVTNADYSVFLDELGLLTDPHKWCHPKEPSRKRELGHEPKYWGQRAWNRADLPVVGVDYWDAYAYARWAGKRLPTEAEWEKTARGTSARHYPWGAVEGLYYSAGAEAWAGKLFADRAAWKREFFDTQPWKSSGLTVSTLAFPRDISPAGVRAPSRLNWRSPNYRGFDVGFRCARDGG